MTFVVFCGAIGYHLAGTSRPPYVAQQATPSSTAYGPALVVEDEFEDNEGEYGLIDPEDDCHPEEVCSSWSGCIEACKLMSGGDECFNDCVVDESLEVEFCDPERDCTCDASHQFCAVFCRADG